MEDRQGQIDEHWATGGDYCLTFYSVPKDEMPRRRMNEGEAVEFLELYGTVCGEEVIFPQGSVYPFFEALHSLTQVDLMCMIGLAPGAKYPAEDDLCCGSCEPEVLLVVVAKFIALVADKEKTLAKAKEKRLNSDWFLKALDLFKTNCEVALSSGGALVTLFE